MTNHKNLLFFNKEGDNLNFNYNHVNDRFEGNILFHENSSDTFKTVGIYTLEKLKSFEYEYPGKLFLDKFQLFNEYGFNFYKGGYTYNISKIEPVNNDPNFYSKWIYADNIDENIKIGSIIKFNSSFLEFTNNLQTYNVVSTKKGAIMIISTTDNSTFETNFSNQYNNSLSYAGKSLSSINVIGIYNYINNLYEDNLSYWNETSFYDKLYKNKKLNIINTNNNDGVYTTIEENLTDNKFFKYYVNDNSLTSNIIIEIITKTDLPKIYEGSINIENNNRLLFNGTIPSILKPGTEFKIVGSNNNKNFLTISTIPKFDSNNKRIFYDVKSQVIFNNKIYECVQSYTQDYTNNLTKYITPLNSDYWTSNITHIDVDQSLTNEYLSNCQLYLTTNKIQFENEWNKNSKITLSTTVEKLYNDFKLFNIDLLYENNTLYANLIYPSKYIDIIFYNGIYDESHIIGNIKEINEKIIEVEESISNEINKNYSSNKSINIVFTDLDEYGLKIKIDNQVYEEEIVWVYSGISVDMERTIDKTLRAWLTRNYLQLKKLGILANLQYTGSYISPFYNSIKLVSNYPNVEMDINEILVGTTANYYVEHSRVLFNDIGNYLSISINGDTFDQSTIYLSGTYSQYPNIPATLQAWVDEHAEYLFTYGIIITNINNLLKFDIKYPDRRLSYNINISKSSLPGINDYIITNKIKGNEGSIITSNEVKISEEAIENYSFIDAGFSTGMAFSINNTFYTWNNTEYNIQYLNEGIMNLSYEGPFWGNTSSSCNTSAFITLAFDLGFGQTACNPPVGPTMSGIGGPFNPREFSSAFSISYNSNSYTLNTYNLNQYVGSNNLMDIIYIQLSDSIYAFGNDVIVMDAYNATYVNTITLNGNTQSQFMRFNIINDYLYCVSKQTVYVIDPLINNLIYEWSYNTEIINDLCINQSNGDIYISFENEAKIEIRNLNNIISSTIDNSSSGFPLDATSTRNMIFNQFESDIYLITDSTTNSIIRIDGIDKSIETSYNISGATGSMFYEPINESIYVFGDDYLYKIDNNIIYTITGVSYSSFNDIIFNVLTNEINLSDSSTSFRGIDLDDNTVSYQKYIGNYGYISLNQFDGDVYISSFLLNNIVVINPVDGTAIKNLPLTSRSTKIIYNPERMSIWTIQPDINSISEVKVTVNSEITQLSSSYIIPEENLYGTLSPEYVAHPDIWLKTKEYLRRPRENYSNDVSVQYYWKWYSDTTPEFFMYDFSGDQLPISGSYAYTGIKPLNNIVLNKESNKDITKCNYSEYQQTIFDEIRYDLSYIDDNNDISNSPTSLELFLGYKSENEGALRSILQLYKKENISISFTSTINNIISIKTLDIDGNDKRGILEINANSSYYFTEKGLKPGQLITILIKDITNTKKQYLSNNNGTIVKIRNVYYKSLIVDFISSSDFLFEETTSILDYPNIGNTTYCKLELKVIDKEIGRFMVYGQTEIEDIRFKTELGNIGKLISPNEVFIFKEYDILEGGIDWKILNKKRKEMLMMKHLIYPYIGAYKSIINAINFFGYNDLQLNEYYKNINPKSDKFLKLFKIEIPDIFDNSVDGWNENSYLDSDILNDDYEGTNMFNLTYKITDKEGNMIIDYSIDEIIIKLQGLKYWLKRNIIPLTHKILDITGQAFFKKSNIITHTSYDTKIFNIRQNMSPVSFKLNEAYLMPINSGSTVYNCILDFYTIVPGYGIQGSIKPFNGVENESPDYFDIYIRTYKKYNEWSAFTNYNIGDKVSYYDKIYESVIINNRLKNPRKYENTEEWVSGFIYEEGNIVNYNRDFFIHTTETSSSSLNPINDPTNWLKITEWKEIDLEPVQTIKEFRNISKGITQSSSLGDIVINPILPFSFTIDSNLDNLITIEVTSNNGYGLIHRDKKNYEIRSVKDLTDPIKYLDQIGPFTPIILI